MLPSAPRRSSRSSEAGFTLVELMVALTIIAGTLVALAYVLYGGMSALSAAHQRSAANEIANAQMEELRALAYSAVGARDSSVTPGDATYAAAYAPDGTFQGRPHVPGTPLSPDAVTVLTTPPFEGAPVPMTIRRWVTWDDPSGGTAEAVKRLDIAVEYLENRKLSRTISLTSVLYPGGQGAGASTSGPVNQAPVAVMTVTPASTPIISGATSVNFDSAGSNDPDGVLLTITWDFGDGTPLVSGVASVSHVYATPGSYTAKLTVTDPAGASDTKLSTLVVVGPANQAPVANLTVVSTDELTVNVLACSTACDPDGDVGLQYKWEWGDGQVTDFPGSRATGHTYAANGSYTIKLTVRDGGNLTSTAQTNVAVAGCGFNSGYFENPPANATQNDVKVVAGNGSNAGTGKAVNDSFHFVAYTSTTCTSVTATLPLGNNASRTFTLVKGAVVAQGQKWEVTANADNNDRFVINAVGVGQSWNFTIKGAGASTFNKSQTFTVHT